MKNFLICEICTNVTSGGTPNTRKSEYYGGDIPWLKTQEVDFNRIYKTETFITNEGLIRSSAKWIPANSVIIAMYGATAGRIAINKIPLTTNQACCNLIIDPEKADYRYVYFNLLSRFKSIANMAVGGAQQNLNAGMIKNLEIDLPPLPTQTAIAEILSSLDDKIELNNQINQNLESLAQALFKQWFVDFEFPNENGEPYKSSGGEMVDSELGEIPKGWEVIPLSKIIEIAGGGTPKRTIDSYWNGDIPWFSIQDVAPQPIIVDTVEKITLEGLKNSSTKLLAKGTTIITARGTVGKLAYIAEEMAMNQSCYGILGKEGIGPIFNYFNLKQVINVLKRNAHGAVFDTITTKTFDSVKIPFGHLRLIKIFDESLNPIFLKIEENVRENVNLIRLRDTLLPKLISGELEVNQIEKEVYG